MSTDPRIDAYIAKAAPFAQPILKHLRATHEAKDGASTSSARTGVGHIRRPLL